MVNHGSAMVVYRTSCCPILFVIILLINKSDSCYQLIKTMTKFGKETRYRLYVFIKKQQQQRQQHTHISVHFHKHYMIIVPLTVVLHCPITSMVHTLYYKCSNWAGDNQSSNHVEQFCHSFDSQMKSNIFRRKFFFLHIF